MLGTHAVVCDFIIVQLAGLYNRKKPGMNIHIRVAWVLCISTSLPISQSCIHRETINAFVLHDNLNWCGYMARVKKENERDWAKGKDKGTGKHGVVDKMEKSFSWIPYIYYLDKRQVSAYRGKKKSHDFKEV